MNGYLMTIFHIKQKLFEGIQMTTYYIDSNENRLNWASSGALELTPHNVSKLGDGDTILIHGKDWLRWAGQPDPKKRDALITMLVSRLAVSEYQLVFFSGEANELEPEEDKIRTQLEEFKHNVEVYFFPDNVNDAANAFGAYIKECQKPPGLLAKDYFSEDLEVLNMSFALLLQAYLLGSLPDKTISDLLEDLPDKTIDKFTQISTLIKKGIKESKEHNKDSNPDSDIKYWMPVLGPKMILNERLASYLNTEGLSFLKNHNFAHDSSLATLNAKNRKTLESWFKKSINVDSKQ